MRIAISLLLAAGLIGAAAAEPTPSAPPATALVLSIDVSGSVDETRYNLQLEGIAEALEDPVTLSAISATRGAGIYLAIVTWADGSQVSLDWRRVASAGDAAAVAAQVRRIPRLPGEFTCVAGMLRTVSDKLLASIPTPVEQVVVDVSSDGVDNCGGLSEVHEARDEVLGRGATINALPILVPGENDVVGAGAFRKPGFGLRALGNTTSDQDNTTLDRWYREHVVGGPGAFLMIARGYEDFSRALRRKLVTEISFLAGVDVRAADAATASK